MLVDCYLRLSPLALIIFTISGSSKTAFTVITKKRDLSLIDCSLQAVNGGETFCHHKVSVNVCMRASNYIGKKQTLKMYCIGSANECLQLKGANKFLLNIKLTKSDA